MVHKPSPSARIIGEGAGRFRIEGEVDFKSVMNLLHQSRVLFRGEERVRLDFSGVERTNSAGLALLIEWIKEARRGSWILELSNLPEGLMAMARICDVESLIQAAQYKAEDEGK